MKPTRAFAAVLPVLLAGAVIAWASSPAEASAPRTARQAPSGGATRSGSPSGTVRSAPSGTGVRTASRTGGGSVVAHGRATYGYNYGYNYGYGYYPGWGWGGGYPGGYGYPYWGWNVGWYGPWWSFGVGWGWPYGDYYYPGPVYYAPAVTPIGGPARVETDVAPRNAVVTLDGEEVGYARDYDGKWDVLPVQSGRRVVTFSAKGYLTLRTVLDAQPGRQYQIAYALQPGEGLDPRSAPETAPEAPVASAAGTAQAETAKEGSLGGLRTGRMKVRITPSDAAVYLDGEFLARGDELQGLHGAIPVAAGTHRVEVVRPGFQSQARDIVIPDGGSTEVSIELDRAP